MEAVAALAVVALAAASTGAALAEAGLAEASTVEAFAAPASVADSAMAEVFAAVDFTIMTSGGGASGSVTAFTDRMIIMMTTVTTIRTPRAIHTTAAEAAMWLSNVSTRRMAGACDRFKCAVDGTIDERKAAAWPPF
jgi:hypothetical protein